MKHHIITETRIVDALHDAASEYGDYAEVECIAIAARELTPDDADDDARETIRAVTRRVWAELFAIMGAF